MLAFESVVRLENQISHELSKYMYFEIASGVGT